MNLIPAQEIKRRGISAVDQLLENGPVHIVKHNAPAYVVMTEEYYQELFAIQEAAYLNRIQESLAEYKSGKVKKGSADDLLKDLGIDD